MKKKEFDEKDTKAIIEMYLEKNMSLKSIGEEFLVSKNIIKRILEECNVAIRKKTTKYRQKTEIFSSIDSDEKAYWLGFVAADGCVYKNKENSGTVIVSLHRKDKKHLERMKEFIGSDREISDYISNTGFGNNTPMSRLEIYSTQMVDDIVEKGVCQRKSLTLKPPLIDQKYWKSFILGYFDGDGSIYKMSQSNNWGFSILGTFEMVSWIREVLDLHDTKIEKQKNAFYIRCGGTNKPYSALKKLYHNDIYSLERKKVLFKEMEKVVLSRNI